MDTDWTYAQITNIGGRESNEDSIACVPMASGLMIVVADGLGGHGRGEMASKLLTDIFSREAEAVSADADFLSGAFEKAQSGILDMQQAHHAPNEMKTTAAALLISYNTASWAHCGDTRVYHFQNNKLISRTLDHSVPQMLVLAGDIKEKHINNHPDRNKLLRVVGVEWDTPRYELSAPVELTNNTAFLLCTDGFWEYISAKSIVKFLKQTQNADDWLRLMVTEVERTARGRNMDNYTAAALRAKG